MIDQSFAHTDIALKLNHVTRMEKQRKLFPTVFDCKCRLVTDQRLPEKRTGRWIVCGLMDQ